MCIQLFSGNQLNKYWSLAYACAFVYAYAYVLVKTSPQVEPIFL